MTLRLLRPRLGGFLLLLVLAAVGLPRLAWADAASTARARGAPATVPAPIAGHPVRLLSVPGGSVLAQMPDGSVRDLETSEVLVPAPSSGRTRHAICDVRGIEPEGEAEEEEKAEDGPAEDGADADAPAEDGVDAKAPAEDERAPAGATARPRARPHVACIRVVVTSSQGSSSSTATVEVVDTEVTSGPRSIASGKAEAPPGALGVGIAPDGEVSWAWTEVVSETVNGAQQQRVVPFLHHEGEDAELGGELAGFVQGLADIGAGDRVPPPIQFVPFGDELWMIRRSGSGLVAQKPGGAEHAITGSALHDVRAVRAADGWVYVLYHSPALQSAFVASSRDGVSWANQLIDVRESGWQLDAAAFGDQVVAVHYFFRNSYHKGMRTVTLEGGRVTAKAATIVREDRHNAGWHPHIGIDGSGRTWLTWLAHVEDEERGWARFDHPDDVRKGALGPSSGWEEEYKDYYLQTGVGGWFTLWHLGELVPDAPDTGGTTLGAATYDVGESLLVSANLEARYQWFNLGLSYAQGIVDDAAEKVEGSTGVLNGSIKLDEAFPGHDFKVEGIWGRYRGTATPGADVIGDDLDVSTDYVDLRAFALNTWRIKYGLGYTTYAVPTTVHAYSAPSGQASYTYQGSHFRDVRLHEIDLLIGWSKLDYAAKYENQYLGPVFDLTVGGGLVIGSYDAIPTPDGDVTGALSLHLRGQALAGLLFFHRIQSLRGFGFYVRPAYVADGGLTGLAGAPESREDTTGEAALGQISFWSVRHGPWLDGGIVW